MCLKSLSVVNWRSVAQFSSALEAFIKELWDKKHEINKVRLHTVAQSIDFLDKLLKHPGCRDSTKERTVRTLVVDDDEMICNAISFALKKASLDPLVLRSPKLAVGKLEDSVFELIFLDVDMPGMTGLELCARIRQTPGNEKTPVIFVTTHSDLNTRAKSKITGGNDYVVKPFLFSELAVKALLYALDPTDDSPDSWNSENARSRK